MRILVFGASGATGRNLVSQALSQEHSVTAFVRDPSKLNVKHERLKTCKGDVQDYRTVENAITDQDAVLSALGASNPFKRDLTLIRGVQNITTAMIKRNVSRFIYQSFLGVSEHRSELGFLIARVLPIFIKGVILDHKEKENIIVNNNHLSWTIVRCSILTNGPFTGNYRDGEHITPTGIMPFISRADVADFMLKQLKGFKYLSKKPRIMY
ncbi:MAG TPA: NAD(P)H-binding protein [Chryseosolibacter sp.]